MNPSITPNIWCDGNTGQSASQWRWDTKYLALLALSTSRLFPLLPKLLQVTEFPPSQRLNNIPLWTSVTFSLSIYPWVDTSWFYNSARVERQIPVNMPCRQTWGPAFIPFSVKLQKSPSSESTCNLTCSEVPLFALSPSLPPSLLWSRTSGTATQGSTLVHWYSSWGGVAHISSVYSSQDSLLD